MILIHMYVIAMICEHRDWKQKFPLIVSAVQLLRRTRITFLYLLNLKFDFQMMLSTTGHVLCSGHNT